MITVWLSFRDSGRNKHLGCLVVDLKLDPRKTTKRDAIWAAIQKAHQGGVNPGGEALGWVVNINPEVPRDRLLVGEELKKWGERI